MTSSTDTRAALLRRSACAVLAATSLGCAPDRDGAGDDRAGGSADGAARPNVLFVVWDTTRADRMSLYGHDRPTTPFLEEWAKDALVFEDCLSTGSSTVPSHGAMFTGLLPSEHGANNLHQHLDDAHDTLAELFRRSGYDTFCFAANPHISRDENFTQGFDVEQHPWDEENLEAALAIVKSKLKDEDRSSELPEKIRSSRMQTWDVKACGALANQRLVEWLDARDDTAPYFAFLNLMEAHRPFVTTDEYRARMMSPEQVARSYEVDRSWNTMWSYTFGLHEYTEEELDVMARTYDACIAELDDLFRDLIGKLEAGGYLENTVVVLTGDHGEHLGEHHMLDHQYSLYQGLVHVPLVLSYPPVVPPGRVSDPVSNFDVFPTLLSLAGIPLPDGLRSKAVSLLDRRPERVRLAEYPSDFVYPIKSVKKLYPDWDSTPFERRLTALIAGSNKLIWASDDSHELYDLEDDPGESEDVFASEARERERLLRLLASEVESLRPFDYDAGNAEPELSREMRERLEALGYFGDEEGD